MEEFDDPTERLHETIEEKAKERGLQKWTLWVAVTTAIMAVFAALASLFSGHDSNEALIHQLRASDLWTYYQAKGIKADIITYASVHSADTLRLQKLRSEQQNIQKQAQQEENDSKHFLRNHLVLARAVTFFQIAIAIAAISVVTGKRFLWLLSLVAALAGLAFLVNGF
jgi:LPS O-antigen subunit length determinant protein (WzzB/FepE family)